jgi:hypothetical protein
MLDVSRQQYGNWLRGAEPELANIRHIAKELGITMIDVVAWLELDLPMGVYRDSFSRPLELTAA